MRQVSKTRRYNIRELIAKFDSDRLTPAPKRVGWSIGDYEDLEDWISAAAYQLATDGFIIDMPNKEDIEDILYDWFNALVSDDKDYAEDFADKILNSEAFVVTSISYPGFLDITTTVNYLDKY